MNAASRKEWMHRTLHGDTTFGPSTLEGAPDEAEALAPFVWALTVLYHPDPTRIGAQCIFATQNSVSTPNGVSAQSRASTQSRASAQTGQTLALSRLEPLFRSPWEGTLAPLGVSHLSRSPLFLHVLPTGIRLEPSSERVQLEVTTQDGTSGTWLDLETLRLGVLLTLAQRVTLMLHPVQAETHVLPGTLLLGVSDALVRLRADIVHLAPLPHPVLITGETGTGKELVAQALHALSPRARARLVTVNMAALPQSTAAAELFGHARGAFTGAAEARPGLFREASGGTLFLDEIGETPLELQPMLLRALEQREIQPLGLPPQRVDVRLVAATDADLEALIQSGRFRRPLFFRLAVSTIQLPPLRERLVDIPLLFVHFLREFLAEQNALHCLRPTPEGEMPWLRRRDVLALLGHAWPGNVRELRQVALQTVLLSHRSAAASLPPELLGRAFGSGVEARGTTKPVVGISGSASWTREPPGGVERLAPTSSPSPPSSSAGPSHPTGAGQLTEALIYGALEACGWRVMAAAEQLGVSRNYLYTQMAELGIRNASSLTAQEILAARQAQPEADLEGLAVALKISPRALKQRLKVLQLAW